MLHYKSDHRSWLSIILCGMTLATVSALPCAEADEGAANKLSPAVADILVRRCLECHGPLDSSGALNLTHIAGLLKGGESGPAVVPGKPDESLLLERVLSGEMPPKKNNVSQPLAEKEIVALRDWIAAGAVWPVERVLDIYEKTSDVRGGRDFWSLQPIVRPPIPTRIGGFRVQNPIDAFIARELAANEMTAAPPAKPGQVIRRLYIDLIGLPPSYEQIEAFVANPSPAAYEATVDRLLASRQFGERWGRYWLDVVRFAETNGYERDALKKHAWRYRDWVINALNRDLPYDRFVLEQLAGDELADRTESTVTATGMLRLGTWDDEPNDALEYQYERLEDFVHVTAAAFIGLTVKCARCHDHKFDPIPQTDYYRIAACFWPGPIQARSRGLAGGPSSEELGFDLLGWTDLTATPDPFHLLTKGDPHRPAQEIAAGSLSWDPRWERNFGPPPASAKTSHRRKQLAEWLVDREHPLPARVIVNRLWQHHFGEGLVRTPDNFGFLGERPTHPALLDWLASELIEGDWHLKRLHKLIVLSATYQQASQHPRQAVYAGRDSANRLWWKFNRQRLDAEALRDSILAASGELNLAVGGPSFHPEINPEALEGLSKKSTGYEVSPRAERNRRSIYMFSQRSLLPPLMTTFDACDTTQPCGQRDVTTVAPQALALLNNSWVHEQSEALARRAIVAGQSPTERIEQTWRLALGRSPNATERAASLAHVESQLARWSDQGKSESTAADIGKLKSFTSLVLWLRADEGLQLDEAGRVRSWQSRIAGRPAAVQDQAAARPRLLSTGPSGQPAVQFSGEGQFMSFAKPLLRSGVFSCFAIVSDRGTTGHREILSNWNGPQGHAIDSIFFGRTSQSAVRISDDFDIAGQEAQASELLLLTAISDENDVQAFQNTVLLGAKGAPLSPRWADGSYALGRQGALDGEYWHGEIAELLVFDSALTDIERQAVWRYLQSRYLQLKKTDPDFLAWASLAHVLLNANEFIYVD